MRLEEYGVTEELSRFIVDYIEEVRELLSSDLWENIFLNCSKNEVFIFWLLYQKGAVNMTEIADYIHVPLNTATGIISRMEKSGLVVRTRSEEDKRVVNIGFSGPNPISGRNHSKATGMVHPIWTKSSRGPVSFMVVPTSLPTTPIEIVGFLNRPLS